MSDINLDSHSQGSDRYNKTFKPRQYHELGGQNYGVSDQPGSQTQLANPYPEVHGPDYGVSLADTAILRTTHVGITTENDSHHKVLVSQQTPWDQYDHDSREQRY